MAGQVQARGCQATQGLVWPSGSSCRLAGASGERACWNVVANAVDGFPSVLWLPALCVLVTIYVDDILAAGRPASMSKFWEELQSHIEIETPGGVDRFLGRAYLTQSQGGVILHMSEYARQCVDLYLSLPGSKPLKAADSPYVAEGTLSLEDYEIKGALSTQSAKILMKLLWLVRLCRPDLSYAISSLASQSATWSKNSDKQVHKLLCYVYATMDLGLKGVVRDKLEDCRVDLFVDADFSGCPRTATSTSGLWLHVSGPSGTQFPIAWSSRR